MIPKVGDIVRLNPNGISGCLWPRAKKYADEGKTFMVLMVRLLAGSYDVKIDAAYNNATNSPHTIFVLKENGVFKYHNGPEVFFQILDPFLPEPGYIKVLSRHNPKNNDGRSDCFWCSGVKTEKRGDGRYDVCPKCGR